MDKPDKNQRKIMGERLKEIRETLGLTRDKFAQKMAIPTTTLKSRELGNTTISQQDIKMLIIEFGTDPNYINTGKGRMIDKARSHHGADNNFFYDSVTTADNILNSFLIEIHDKPAVSDINLKMIVRWMNDYFEKNPAQSIQFLDDLRKLYPDLDLFIKTYNNGPCDKRKLLNI